MPREIVAARASDFRQQAQTAHREVAFGGVTTTDHAIDAFADEVHQTVAFAELELQSGMPRKEVGKRRQQPGAGELCAGVDPQNAHGDATSQRYLDPVHLAQHGDAMAVIALALVRRCNMPRRTAQQGGAEGCLQSLDAGRSTRSRQAEIVGGGAEAAPFHHPHEKTHRGKSVHRELFAWTEW